MRPFQPFIGFLALTLSASLFLSRCANAPRNNSSSPHFPRSIMVQGDRFVDDLGREVILNGINVVSKSKEENYLFPGGPEFYANLKKWGFNSIRFIMIWDGLEPEPGVYNEGWLKELDKRIAWAAENGLYLILDMHQDLFSVNYADGAPEWATLTEGKPHIAGDVWSDAYLISPAVQTAFDNFWANAEAPDGIGLQDHYANLWQHIAERYADNPTIIGYDIMNEPFPGSSAQQAMPALLEAYGQLVYQTTGEVLSAEQLEAMWGDVSQRTEALKAMSEAESFAQVIDALYPVSHAFETTSLQPFYQKVADAIRAVDSTHVLFLEHAYFANLGVQSSIQRTALPNGRPDPRVAYAPHAYDLVTDTEQASEASEGRLSFIFDRIANRGESLGMPIWLGEWGAYYAHGEAVVPVAKYAIAQIEKHLFGNAYWSYDPGLENQLYFQEAIVRPYPAYTSGKLMNYANDPEEKVFSMAWSEDPSVDAPTMVFLPNLEVLNTDNSVSDTPISTLPIEGSEAGWVIIPPSGQAGDREIELHFQ